MTYIKPGYIGFLTINHGVEVGLDSLAALTTPEEKALPFYTSYTAYLEMERGNYTRALALVDSLKLIINNPEIPMPYALTGTIYARMDSLYPAIDNLNKALELDSNDVGSERLRTEMYTKTDKLWDRWINPDRYERPRIW